MNTGRSLKNMLMENVTCKAVLPYERFMQCGAESLTEEELLAKLKAYSQELKEQVEAKDARLQEVGYKNY